MADDWTEVAALLAVGGMANSRSLWHLLAGLSCLRDLDLIGLSTVAATGLGRHTR